MSHFSVAYQFDGFPTLFFFSRLHPDPPPAGKPPPPPLITVSADLSVSPNQQLSPEQDNSWIVKGED